jgi:hypothetical protein
MGGWVCRLQLLLVLVSTVILRSESRGTHDHILLSQIWDSPNLEGQVPVFISPRNRVAGYTPRHWVSLFVASYDSQGHGGGIRTLLHMGLTCINESIDSIEFMNELRVITSRELNRGNRLQGFHYFSSWLCCLGNLHEPLHSKMNNSVSGSTFPAFRRCVQSRCLANVFFSGLLRKLVLASRYLTTDYSGFQAPFHNTLWLNTAAPGASLTAQVISSVTLPVVGMTRP